MKHLFLKILVLTSITVTVHAETYCSTRKFSFADPHQLSDVVGRFVSSQNHASLFEKVGLVEKVLRTHPTKWVITLRKNRQVNARMVVDSISRQLLMNARFESEEESFFPAKLAGLDALVKSVTATGAEEVLLEFNRAVDEIELKHLLNSPVGIVFSVDALPLINSPILLKGQGKSPAAFVSEKFIKLGPDNSPAYILKFIEPEKASLKVVRGEGCKRLYYPPELLRREVAKAGGTIIRASTTLLFVRIFPELPKNLVERLRASLHPDRMTSLKDFPQTNRITDESKIGPSSVLPSKDNSGLPNTFLTCAHVSLPSSSLKTLEDQLRTSFKLSLGVDLTMGRVGCERIPLVRSSGDRLGVLSAIEFRSKSELEDFLRCKNGVSVFGSCALGKSGEMDAEILSKGQVFPLALIRNEFVEFY